jgi:hypothetical protein
LFFKHWQSDIDFIAKPKLNQEYLQLVKKEKENMNVHLSSFHLFALSSNETKKTLLSV